MNFNLPPWPPCPPTECDTEVGSLEWARFHRAQFDYLEEMKEYEKMCQTFKHDQSIWSKIKDFFRS